MQISLPELLALYCKDVDYFLFFYLAKGQKKD